MGSAIPCISARKKEKRVLYLGVSPIYGLFNFIQINFSPVIRQPPEMSEISEILQIS